MNTENKTTKQHFPLKILSCMALTCATMAANSACAYIYHDPKKPAELNLLKKF